MMRVGIAKNWTWPDLMRQTPRSEGIWDGVQFTLSLEDPCDYVIVLNRVAGRKTIQCPPQHVWAIMQEPPNEHFASMHRGDVRYRRIYTSDVSLRGKRYILSHPALPWHVNKTYDSLTRCSIPKKERSLSWITSSKAVFQGHRERMRFLERIKNEVAFDLYGRGFSYVQDKWEALAPYRYALAVENFRNAHYWSEKLADCFLSWTMPIYYGCTRITEYFPAEAMICIDIHDPYAVDKIREAVSSNQWRRNLDAIEYARQLVLEQYQLFPFVVREIRRNERSNFMWRHHSKPIVLAEELHSPWTVQRIQEQARKYARHTQGKMVSAVKQLLK